MTGSGKLGKSYGKYGSNPDRIKSIRLTEDQDSNWDPDLVRSVLEGSNKSNDSIRINKLKGFLKGLYDIMNDNMNAIIPLTPEEMELLLNIEEVIPNE